MYWIPGTQHSYVPSIIETIYYQHIVPATEHSYNMLLTRLTVLELSAYLENYLWKYYTADASYAHVMSIIMLVNIKAHQNLLRLSMAWELIAASPSSNNTYTTTVQSSSNFQNFCMRIILLKREKDMSTIEAIEFVRFLSNIFACLENQQLQSFASQLCGINLLRSVDSVKRKDILDSQNELLTAWTKLDATCKQLHNATSNSTITDKKAEFDAISSFIPSLIREFFHILTSIKFDSLEFIPEKEIELCILYCERFIESIHTICSQLQTRRYIYVLLQDCAFALLCRESFLYKSYINLTLQLTTKTVPPIDNHNDYERRQNHPGRLFVELVDKLSEYLRFPIDSFTGETISDHVLEGQYYSSVNFLQRVAFSDFREELLPFALLGHFSQITLKDFHSKGESTILEICKQRNSLLAFLDRLPLPRLLELSLKAKALSPSHAEMPSDYRDDGNYLTSHITTTSSILHAVFPDQYPPEFLKNLILDRFVYYGSFTTQLNNIPLFPSESLLFDERIVPSANFSTIHPLAVPKLNLQFLCMEDYLLRSFQLYTLESAFAIREDILSAILQVCIRTSTNQASLRSSRMATPIESFSITTVRPPLLGEYKPSQVVGEITLDLSSFTGNLRTEWESIREHDVMFLVFVPPEFSSLALDVVGQNGEAEDRNSADHAKHKKYRNDGAYSLFEISQQEQHPIEKWIPHLRRLLKIRGVVIRSVTDETGKIIGSRDPKTGEIYKPIGSIRKCKLHLDAAQYYLDQQTFRESNGIQSLYSQFNVVVRRKPKENNFSGVLTSIRDILQSDTALPHWLHHVILGYDKNHSSQYYTFEDQITTFDFMDTFLDRKHLEECFLESVKWSSNDSLLLNGSQDGSNVDGMTSLSNFRTLANYLTQFHESTNVTSKEAFRLTLPAGTPPNLAALVQYNYYTKPQQHSASDMISSNSNSNAIVAQPIVRIKARNTYVRENQIRFTPMQVQAIRSGMSHGLTVIVGPPGTGKSDTAVQLVSELTHNFPTQRILLLTHSNHALNDLFEKLLQRDIDERYMLRLGRGSQEVESALDFSRFGRVNYILNRRQLLLTEVNALGKSLGFTDDVANTCQTASHFYLQQVLSRWEKFILEYNKLLANNAEISNSEGNNSASGPTVSSIFPFTSYFTTAIHNLADITNDPTPSSLFSNTSAEQDMAVATSCFAKLQLIFSELEEYRPYEILKTYSEKSDYFLTKHAKLIAMTCTHAALRRAELIRLQFQYDTVVIEEAGQLLEAETIIPLFLQSPSTGDATISRLKRVILLGDHQQLPPIVTNRAIASVSHMDQSFFTRLIRLGVPAVHLTAQGRCRPSLAKLWNWAYQNLGDLPIVHSAYFQYANVGFSFDYQFIDSTASSDSGESCPMPHFYQNVAESEYVVAVYMYMRLIGYPASQISILTTYNGQKQLIRDMIAKKCSRNPLFGYPAKIATVDKYQGQQNDIILLSLVRTKHAGHLRDVRRLIVALSRARKGLYVFGSATLFANCYELTPAMSQFMVRPLKLQLVPGERCSNQYGIGSSRPLMMTGANEGLSIELANVQHMQGFVQSLLPQTKNTNYRKEK